MSTISREQQKQILIDTANHVINRENTSPHSENMRELARIALTSLEAEPVISHVGSKNALDDIVAFIKSNRNPTLKDHNQVSERLFQDNCHGLSNHVIEYIKQIGEGLEELRSTQDTAPPAPVSVPTFDEWLEISGNKPLGWVKDAMRESYDACRSAMLQGADGNSPVIPDGWVMVPVELTGAMTNAMTDAILDDLHNVDVWRSVLAAAPQQEVK